jgi:hypothetical protein
MTPSRGGEEEEVDEVGEVEAAVEFPVEAAVEFPIEAAAAASPITVVLVVARVAPNLDPVPLGVEGAESCIVEAVATSPTGVLVGVMLVSLSAAFSVRALASLSAPTAPSVLSVPSSLTVGRFVIVPRRSAKNAEILSKRLLKSVVILPVRFTMNVGITPGVGPSGEPPSWEPVYTPALLVAVWWCWADGPITIAMGCTGDPTWKATEWSTLSLSPKGINVSPLSWIQIGF